MGFTNGLGVTNLKFGVVTNVSTVAVPYDGQVVYETDNNRIMAYNGSAWQTVNGTVGSDGTVLIADSSQASGTAWSEQSLGYRNVIINGAMQVHQRGTSTASLAGGGYFTADRWAINNSNLGTWTQSVENDAPTGSGFRKSLKMLCTTADASPAAGDEIAVGHLIEGQNLQQFCKGTSSAKQFVLSFWVKANVTGTYIVWLYDPDNNRETSLSYQVSSSATWEKKTLVFAADTTGAFDNDNAVSLYVRFYLGAGSSLTSGSLSTTWATATAANRAVGQTNLAAATNNYWQITGVQLEAGSVATPFEFEGYGVTLAKCQRYCYVIGKENNSFSPMGFTGNIRNSTTAFIQTRLPQNMRGAPTVTVDAAGNFFIDEGVAAYTPSAFALDRYSANALMMYATVSGATAGRGVIVYGSGSGAGVITVSAEL